MVHRSLLLSLLSSCALVGCGDDGAIPDPDAGVPDAGAPDTGAPDTGSPPQCDFEGTADALADPEPYVPRWAFEPWISKDISDAADSRAFVQGFVDRDIPVSALVIDSPWADNYNTFVPNEDRYPRFGELVEELHGMGVRVVLWTTQMVNRTSFDLEDGGDVYPPNPPLYRQGLACGFYVDGGRSFGWWKGTGGAVDFFHPGALAWWRRQQDHVLDLGIDGWKLDFGESYIRQDHVETFAGTKTFQAYSEEYYADFLRYGVERRGREFVTMVRGYDQSYDFEGRFFARHEHAPVVWMGDNERNWEGLADALDHTFRSARAGYVNVGSDIGGYLDRDELDLMGPRIEFDHEVFARWVAVEAMTPFFQLHGRANLTPWTVPERVDETVALYRYWAKLHTQLVPFWFSLARQTHLAGDAPPVRPIGDGPAQWAGDYRFEVGDAFLVAPLLEAGGARDVELPEGRWYDFWDRPADAQDGGVTVAFTAPDRVQIPIWVREGAIVPMDVRDDSTGFGDAASAGHLTVLLWPAAEETSFVLHDEDDATTTLTLSAAGFSLSRATRPVLAQVHRDGPPAEVLSGSRALTAHPTREALAAAADGWLYDAATRTLWVKLPASDGPRRITVR